MQEFVIQNSKGNDVTTSLIVADVFGMGYDRVINLQDRKGGKR